MKITVKADHQLPGTETCFSEPVNMIQAMVDLRRAQLKGATTMTIELTDVQEGDV